MSQTNERFLTYAALIQNQIIAMFDKESENYIDQSDFEDSENFKQFLHALSSVVPTAIYNLISEDPVDSHLGFNHLANRLCFEYCKKIE